MSNTSIESIIPATNHQSGKFADTAPTALNKINVNQNANQMHAIALIGDRVTPSPESLSKSLPKNEGAHQTHQANEEENDSDGGDMAMDVVEHELLGHILGPIWAMIKAQSDIQSNKEPIDSVGKAGKIDPKLRGDVGSNLMVAPRLQSLGTTRRPLIDFSGIEEMRSLRPR